MRHLIQMRGLAVLAAVLLIAAPAWSGPGAQSGGGQRQPPDATTDPPGDGGRASRPDVSGPYCGFYEQGDQARELFDFWNCVDDAWEDSRYEVHPLLLGHLTVGLEVEDLVGDDQEICFFEDNIDMAWVRVWADADTTGHIGKIRKLEDPNGDGDGYVAVSINGSEEYRVATTNIFFGTLTAVQLNYALVSKLQDLDYLVTEDPDFIYVHNRYPEQTPPEEITELTIRSIDTGLLRFELAIEHASGPAFGPNCEPFSPPE